MLSRSRITLVVWIAAVATALAVQTATVHAAARGHALADVGPERTADQRRLAGPSNNDLMWVAGYQTRKTSSARKPFTFLVPGLQAMNFDGTLRWTCPIGSTDQCCPSHQSG